jgi:hypothetical protein
MSPVSISFLTKAQAAQFIKDAMESIDDDEMEDDDMA